MATTGNPLKDIAEIPGYQLEDLVAGASIVKGPLTLPQSATATLFTVTGLVLVTSLIGVVTTATGATATNLSLGTAPTVGTAATAGIGGPTAVTSLVAGTCIAAPAAAGAGGQSLTAPSVPASTVTATNNYHGSVDVAISGGTVTFVFVNGVQVATTTGVTVTVPAHGTISITYSIAPTWTWTGSVALEIGAGGAISVPKDVGFLVPAGTITWTTSASDTGAVKWYINYVPINASVLKGTKVS
jgi:hypothetical protein